MRPILFEIGNFKVHSFGLLVMLGFIAGLYLARRRAARFGFSEEDLTSVTFWILVPGILGARILFVVQEWGYYKQHPAEIFSQFSGLTSFGGLIFGFLGVLLWRWRRRVALWPLLDWLAPSFLVAHAIGRIGCLLNGCCYGGTCTLPWGIHVPEQPGKLVHPAQVYDALMNLAALPVLLRFERIGRPAGFVFGLMVALHGLARFIYEFWRAGTTSTYMGSLPITDAQAMALALVVVGVAIMATRRKEPETA